MKPITPSATRMACDDIRARARACRTAPTIPRRRLPARRTASARLPFSRFRFNRRAGRSPRLCQTSQAVHYPDASRASFAGAAPRSVLTVRTNPILEESVMTASAGQDWQAERYACNARFVADLGSRWSSCWRPAGRAHPRPRLRRRRPDRSWRSWAATSWASTPAPDMIRVARSSAWTRTSWTGTSSPSSASSTPCSRTRPCTGWGATRRGRGRRGAGAEAGGRFVDEWADTATWPRSCGDWSPCWRAAVSTRSGHPWYFPTPAAYRECSRRTASGSRAST